MFGVVALKKLSQISQAGQIGDPQAAIGGDVTSTFLLWLAFSLVVNVWQIHFKV